MATKTERFKAEVMRAAHGMRPAGNTHESAGKRVAATGRRKDRLPNPTAHNEGPRARKNSTYEIEYDLTARAPRKSTRTSPTHIKTDSALRIKVMNANASPQARSGRTTGNPV